VTNRNASALAVKPKRNVLPVPQKKALQRTPREFALPCHAACSKIILLQVRLKRWLQERNLR